MCAGDDHRKGRLEEDSQAILLHYNSKLLERISGDGTSFMMGNNLDFWYST